MYFIQRLFALILNPVYALTGKINIRIRNACISLCCIFMSIFFIAYYDTYNRLNLYLNHGHNNLICGAVLILLIVFSIDRPLEKVKWVPLQFWLFFLSGAGLFFISLLHPIGDGYRSFGLMMMFLFPCLYYVWNNRGDYNVLYIRLTGAASAVGLVFYIYCIKAAFAGNLIVVGGRTAAFFFNANLFSMVGMAMVCSAVYMFTVNMKSLPWFLFGALSFAAGWEIILLGVSRLSMLVGIGSIFALVIFSFKTYGMIIPARSGLESFIKVGIITIIIILIVAAGSVMMDVNSTIQYKRAAGVPVETPEKTGDDSTDTTGDTEIEIPPEVTENNVQSASDRMSTSDKDLNTYTAGRINIWNGYASQLNLLGNNLDETDFAELTGTGVQHAHNNFLEYAYRCGIPVACLHILLELYSGIVCIFFLFKKKYKDPAYLFAVVFMICYAVESMFDIATLPFERHAPFYFYMALIPVFGRLNDFRQGRVSDQDDSDRILDEEREYKKLRAEVNSQRS